MQYTVLLFILKMFTNNKPFKNLKNGEEKKNGNNYLGSQRINILPPSY